MQVYRFLYFQNFQLTVYLFMLESQVMFTADIYWGGGLKWLFCYISA
jgi:hypothetical protein